MLWLESEAIFSDIIYQKPNITETVIIENTCILAIFQI
jgi:hypothetical protein